MQIHAIDHPALRLFSELMTVPAPSGREERIAAVIRGKLDGWGYGHETDGAGSVLVRLEGSDPDAGVMCLAAHTDEIGLVVIRVEPDGSLLVGPSGGLLPWKIGERPVDVLGDHETMTGIVSMGSAHSLSAGEGGIKWKDVRILTGMSADGLRAAGVRPGSVAVPVREGCGPVVLGDSEDPLVAAWTFDDRMGVVALLRMLEAVKRESIRPRRPTIVALTAREEVGALGAMALAQAERPEVFIAIDGCPMPPDAPVKLDGRPGVWAKDRSGYSDHGLVRALCDAAGQAGTELQPVVYDAAYSDAGKVATCGGAHRVATFGHVRENSHGYEVARLSVFDNVMVTLVRFLANWEG